MEKILVSACLLGINCKYNGKNNYNKKVIEYLKDKEVIPMCPEVFGGLGIPREASEINNDKIITSSEKDVTDYFKKGANETLYLAKLLGVKKALLKSKSPSCGYGKVYDGTFSDSLINGKGITAKLLEENGIDIITENDI